MKTKLNFNFLIFLFLAFNSFAQKNARPEIITMTLQVGGTTPSNLGGPLTFSALLPVLAWSEGISSSCTTQNTCPTPNQQDLSLTLYQSAEFIRLRQALLNNSKFNLELVSTSSTGDVSKIYLEDASISSISTGGSGGEDRLTMNISIYAPKWDHFFDTNGPGAGIHYGWNFVTNSPFTHY